METHSFSSSFSLFRSSGLALLATSLAAFVVGCSSSNLPSSAGDGGTSGGACNDIDLGPVSTASATAELGAAPAASGGTIVDGTYWDEGNTLYGASTTNDKGGKFVFEISGGVVQFIGYAPEASAPTTYTYALATDGAALTFTTTCPDTGFVLHYAYSADAGSLTLFDETADGNTVGIGSFDSDGEQPVYANRPHS